MIQSQPHGGDGCALPTGAGCAQVGAIRRTDCKTFVATLSRTLSPATVKTVYAVLRSVMQSAVDDGLIAANPCSRVPLPRVERRVVEPLNAADVRALADAISPNYAVAVWIAACAGLREGEVLGLTAARIDFLRRRIHVEQQLQSAARELPALVDLKTRASRRVVPVDSFLLDVVAEHMQRWPVADGGPICRNRVGKSPRRSGFGDAWRAAVVGAGLPSVTRFHDLRHFYASTLIAGGLHPKAVQARLGHATITETIDVYGHLFPDAEDAGRGVMDAAFNNVPFACPDEVPG